MDMTRNILLTAASLAEQPDFTLGEISVCPARRLVEGPGGAKKVEPRVMQVLIALAEAQGAVVTREALLERCWGGVFVSDDSLNRAIGGVRRLAAGIGRGGFEVETVPRTGYRLVSHREGGVLALGDAEPATASSAQGGDRMARRLVLGAGLASGLAAAAVWFANSSGRTAAGGLIEDSELAMRSGTPEGQKKAVALLERAVSLEPDNSAAWGLLALTRARIDEHVTDDARFSLAQISAEAQRALRLDDANADAKSALALAVPYYGDWTRAEDRFDKVLEQHPDHLFTRDARAFLWGAVGRLKEGARERLKFPADAAFHPDLQHRHIYALWFLDRIAEADRVAARGLEMWPAHAGLWFGKLWLLAGTGRLDRAIAFIDDQQARPKLPPPMFETLRAPLVVAASGDAKNAGRVIDGLLAGAERNVAAVVNALMLLNLMGAIDPAFDLAEAYYLEQGPILAAMQWRPGQPVVPDQRRRKTNMLFIPISAGMRRDPRFPRLMERMGLADYWERSGTLPDHLESARA